VILNCTSLCACSRTQSLLSKGNWKTQGSILAKNCWKTAWCSKCFELDSWWSHVFFDILEIESQRNSWNSWIANGCKHSDSFHIRKWIRGCVCPFALCRGRSRKTLMMLDACWFFAWVKCSQERRTGLLKKRLRDRNSFALRVVFAQECCSQPVLAKFDCTSPRPRVQAALAFFCHTIIDYTETVHIAHHCTIKRKQDGQWMDPWFDPIFIHWPCERFKSGAHNMC